MSCSRTRAYVAEELTFIIDCYEIGNVDESRKSSRNVLLERENVVSIHHLSISLRTTKNSSFQWRKKYQMRIIKEDTFLRLKCHLLLIT